MTGYIYNPDYEIAIEVLGQSNAIWVKAYWEEEKKPNPNHKLLKFYESKQLATDYLMDTLDPQDIEIINLILDKDNDILRR